jgi:alcohol dehydrogenase class IV
MDAMTHAVEAFIGNSNTNETRENALEAVALINKYLLLAYSQPENLEARAGMLTASYKAGVAFTRAYVGYVHAIAHTIGGFYKVPHGLANAIIMPHVLEYYGEAVHGRLATLADHIGIGGSLPSHAEKAKAFIQYLRDLNRQMDIPATIDKIQETDLPEMIKRALAEANPLYPVPKILFADDLKKIYLKVRG